jgi:hypothetical protein
MFIGGGEIESRKPDFGKEFIIRTDASSAAAGYALSQIQKGMEVPLAFGGKIFNKHELNYTPGQKELYSIFLAAREWQSYIYGQKLRVFTDHKAWTWLKSIKSPNGVVMRWCMELMEYDMVIDWVPGVFNNVADTLSRLWVDIDQIQRSVIDFFGWVCVRILRISVSSARVV